MKNIIMKLLFGLLLFITFGASGSLSHAGNENSSSKIDVPDFSSIVVSEYGLPVPHQGLADVVELYNQSPQSLFQKNADIVNFLKEFVITYSPEFIRAHQVYFTKQNASIEFLSDLEAAKDWYVAILWESSEAIHKIASSQKSASLNFMLSHRAERMNALHETYDEYVSKYMTVKSKKDLELYGAHIYKMAQQNYRPAMIHLAESYSDGLYLMRAPQKAYFWYLNALWEGAAVSSQLKTLERELRQDQIAKIRKIFWSGEYPSYVEETEKRNPKKNYDYQWVPPYLDVD